MSRKAPTTISLTTIGTAKAVDAGDGVVWVLALGSEAAAGDDVMAGLTDAIQLVGVNLDTGRALAIGLPRDLYVEMSDGSARLNTALRDEGTDGVAREVEELLAQESVCRVLARVEHVKLRDIVPSIHIDICSERKKQ